MPPKLFLVSASILASASMAQSALADEPTSTWTTKSPVTSTSVSTTATTSADFAPEPTAIPPAPPAIAFVPRETVAVYERRPNKALLITGASIFVTTYALTASFAAAGQRASDRDLFVPVAGPFMNLANRNCARDCASDPRDTALLITSGVMQNIGAALMIASAFVPEKVAVPRIAAGPVKIDVTPSPGGLGATGAF